MQIKKMDDTLLKINQIKNIISINYTDIFTSDEATKKTKILPGFSVVYEDFNIILLAVDDPYFEEFVRKIKQVYKKEKAKKVPQGMGTIKISPFTESLLLNGDIDSTSTLYNYYKGKEAYTESLLFEEDKVKYLFPIIEYHIKETLEKFEKTISIREMKLSEGINGSYYIKAKINNTTTILPMYFEEKEENIYQVMIGNLVGKAIPIKMIIHFTNASIKITTRIEEYNFMDAIIYQAEDETIKKKVDTYFEGDLITYTNEELKQEQNPHQKITRLDNKEEYPTWYSLPWGAYLGFKETITYIKEDGETTEEPTKDKMITKQMIYQYDDDSSFYIKEMISKKYQKETEKNIDSECIVFDYLNKTIIGLKQKKGYVIETSFNGPAATGFYKTELDKKYFYHISKAQSIQELTSDSIIPLSKEDGLLENVDLLDIGNIQKYK